MIKFIHDSVSLCNHCYRHIPAIVYEEDEQIWIGKKCRWHGEQKQLVETDPEFYYKISHLAPCPYDGVVMFETTNKCQLDCPHCYQLPDNKVADLPLDVLISTISSYPNGYMPMLAGAECTLYKDIIPLSHYISDKYKTLRLLTNGIRFSDMQFTRELMRNNHVGFTIGLNHRSYQGNQVHEKQLKGIDNIVEVGGGSLGEIDIGYTVEDLDHIPEILEEIDTRLRGKADLVRIRLGSFIGRSSDNNRNFLSKTIAKIKSVIGNELIFTPLDDNPYHIMCDWKGLTLRIIQWPDVENIDLEELNTGPWSNFQEGPITNFVHQVILRDAFINKGLPRYDWVPTYYQIKVPKDTKIKHWKTNWEGPIEITGLNYHFTELAKTPGEIFKWKN